MSNIDTVIDTPGITDVPGFECGSAACDILGKGNKRPDLALVSSPSPCVAAGVFTQNDLKSPAVILSQEHLGAGSACRAIITNSGNANACTGAQGLSDARAMAQTTADALGISLSSVLVCSTGRIGPNLPMQKILPGIAKTIRSKRAEPQAGHLAAQAILTSDTCTKSATARFTCNGETVTLAAMAKGAGMISPNMATMLAFVATDAQVPKPLLSQLLKEAVDESFNCITIDGDMSTNDTVLLLANGQSGVAVPQDSGSALYRHFAQALKQLCASMAEKIVGDGERITKIVEIQIHGAPSDAAAQKVGRAIANSLLVKSAWYGNDPNWGRIVHAAGYAGAGLVEHQLDLAYHTRVLPEGLPPQLGAEFGASQTALVLEKGRPILSNADQWQVIVSHKHFGITLDMHLGQGQCRLLTTDLSEAYVDFNKSE